MSHFTVLVVGPNIEDQLAPYHEFECTGEDNQYVQEVDETEEARHKYESQTETRLKEITEKFPLGVLHDPYDERFYREPTEEELSKHGKFGLLGSGSGDGIGWSSRDWNDGKGYRAKIKFIPEGMTEVEVPRKDTQTFAEFVDDYYGHKVVPFGQQPDFKREHKFGYTLIDEKGEVIKTVDRTNPESKWDWYQIGGRWTGFFKMKVLALLATTRLGKPGLNRLDPDYKPPAQDRADQCIKGDIDVDGMRQEAADKAAEKYDLFTKIVDGLPAVVPWDVIREKHGTKNIDAARQEYNSQQAVQALRANKETMWFDAEDFSCTEEEYVDRARKSAFSTFAVVKDGK